MSRVPNCLNPAPHVSGYDDWPFLEKPLAPSITHVDLLGVRAVHLSGFRSFNEFPESWIFLQCLVFPGW